MARQTIKRLLEQMPEHGLALHGTLSERSDKIELEGIKPSRGGYSFFMPIAPGASTSHKYKKGALSNAIWQTEIAISYGQAPGGLFIKAGCIPTREKFFPTVVILRGTREIPFTTDAHRYLGSIPKKQVAKIVKITRKEMNAISASVEPENKTKALKRLLTRKTLAAIREVIEAEARRKEASEVATEK